MPDSTFHFKQFIVHQDKCAMKVGTDAVLLGSWVAQYCKSNPSNKINSVLDIGTGTGIIALMIAQETEAIINAIDIDMDAVEQARNNILESKWKDRIHVFHISLQEYFKQKPSQFDLIVSNPPYFDETYKPAEEGRNKARHTDNLSFEDLAIGIRTLLNPKGKFFVILPLIEGTTFIEKMKVEGLFCNKQMHVKSKKDRVDKRLMMQFSFYKTKTIESDLIIHNEDQSYSDDYIKLTSDYYL